MTTIQKLLPLLLVILFLNESISIYAWQGNGHGNVTVIAPRVVGNYYVAFIDHYPGDIYISKIGSPPNWKLYNIIDITPNGFKGTIGNFDVRWDSKKIVFSSNRSGNWDIYIGDLNFSSNKISTENIVSIAASHNREEDPKFSWNGERIVYKNNMNEIWIYDLTSRKAEKVIGGKYEKWAPTFDPTGTRIAYTNRTKNRGDEIYVYNLITRSIKRITNNNYPDWYPTFMPNGDLVYVNSSINDDLWLYNYSTGKFKEVYSGSTSDADPYSFKDTSEWLVFIKQNENGKYNLCLFDMDSKTPYILNSDINVLGPVVFIHETHAPTLHHGIKISNIFAPSSVRTSQDFHIAISVSYDFSSNTDISIGIWNRSDDKKLTSVNDVVSGCDFKIYNFELRSPTSTGVLEFIVNALYSEGGEERIGDKQLLRVPVVKGEISYSTFKVTDSFFNVSYNGKWYKAFYMYNTTWQAPPDYNNTEAFYKWSFSHYNWLVLNSSSDLVNNVDDYVKIAFAAQTALVGIEDYKNVVNKGELFKELSGYAITAETCRAIGSIATGMIGGIVLGYVTPSFTIKFFAQSLVNEIEKGMTDPEELIKHVAIEDLISSSSNLYKAADIIKPVYEEAMSEHYGYPYAFLGVHVDYEDIVQYYIYKKNGFVIGLSSMHTLSKIYDKGVEPYLKSIAQSLIDSSLAGAKPTELVAYAEKLITETPELKGFLRDLAKEENRYNIMNDTFFKITKQIASSLKNEKLFSLREVTSSGRCTVNASVLINAIIEKSGAGKPEIDMKRYTSNPEGRTPFKSVKFIDVKLNDSSDLDYIFLKVYYTDSEISGLNETSLKLYWWNGSKWVKCSNTGVDIVNNYVWANITNNTIPTLNQLRGTVFSLGGRPKPISWYQQYWYVIVVCIVLIAVTYIWHKHKSYNQ